MAEYAVYTKIKTDALLSAKQDKLIAGSNIHINGTTISSVDTKYAVATPTTAGLLSASDKKKIDALSTTYAPIAKGVTITLDGESGIITFTQ